MADTKTNSPREGWLEMASRVVGVLLDSAEVKDRLAVVLRYIDPDGAPALTRALLWTDAALSLAVLRALPEAANAGIELFCELLVQLETIPPAAMLSGLRGAARRVRVRSLGEATGRTLGWAVRLRREAKTRASEQQPDRQSARAALRAGLVEGLAATGVAPGEAFRALLLEPLTCLGEQLEAAARERPEQAAALRDALRAASAPLRRRSRPTPRRGRPR